jgi:hypothetical protein
MMRATDTAFSIFLQNRSPKPGFSGGESSDEAGGSTPPWRQVAMGTGHGIMAGGHQQTDAPERQSAQRRGVGGALDRVTWRGNGRKHVHPCLHERSNRLDDGRRVLRRLHHGGSGGSRGSGGVCARSPQHPNPQTATPKEHFTAVERSSPVGHIHGAVYRLCLH